MIIDATDLILGRLASYAAKKALLGEEVQIINSEKAIITGRREMIIKKYLHDQSRGTHVKGPFLPKKPNLFVRRIIRGMLPHKADRGQIAYKRIRCHIGVPLELKDKKYETIKGAHYSKIPYLYYTTVGDVSKQLGAKFD